MLGVETVFGIAVVIAVAMVDCCMIAYGSLEENNSLSERHITRNAYSHLYPDEGESYYALPGVPGGSTNASPPPT